MGAFLVTPLGKGILYFLTVCCAIAFIAFCFKIWLVLHDKQVLSGYVLLTEKTAADMRVKDLEKQVAIAQKTYEETRKRQLADDLVIQAKDAQNDKDVADYEKQLADAKDPAGKPMDARCFATAGDAKFVQHH